jgi:hypothetical protein
MSRPIGIGRDQVTIATPTPMGVVLRLLPWAALFVSGLVGDVMSDGILGVNGQVFSLGCYLVVAYIAVGRSHEVRLEPGTMYLRTWNSIAGGGPAEEIILGPKSQYYRDTWGRVFVDGHEVRLYFGYGWKPLAGWFERAGIPVFDDRAELEARNPLLRIGSALLNPLLFAAALAVAWAYPLFFSAAAVSVGTLWLLYAWMISHHPKGWVG